MVPIDILVCNMVMNAGLIMHLVPMEELRNMSAICHAAGTIWHTVAQVGEILFTIQEI